MTRSIIAVTAGLLSLIILTYIANMVALIVFMSANGNPNHTAVYLVVSAVYTVSFGIAGGFMTANISTETLHRDISILSALVFLLWFISSIFQLGRQPIWYSLLLLITVPMAVLAGGQIRISKLKKEEDSQFK